MACESGTSSRPTCTPILFPDIRNWPNARARRFTSAEARGQAPDRGSRDPWAYAGKHLPGGDGRREVEQAVGGVYRRHVIHRRCGAPRPVEDADAGTTCREAVRQPARETADAAG